MAIKDFKNENDLVNKYFCNFIANKFLRVFRDQSRKEISQNKYAKFCGLSPSTITKLKSDDGYDVPMSTVYNICRFEKISISKLYKEFEKKHGVSLPS